MISIRPNHLKFATWISLVFIATVNKDGGRDGGNSDSHRGKPEIREYIAMGSIFKLATLCLRCDIRSGARSGNGGSCLRSLFRDNLQHFFYFLCITFLTADTWKPGKEVVFTWAARARRPVWCVKKTPL